MTCADTPFKNENPLTQKEVTLMELPRTNVTSPLLATDSALWFSVYGFGWGYRASSIPVEALRGKLGTANATPGQLMLAFESSRRQLLEAIEHKAWPPSGKRIALAGTYL